MNTLQLRRRFQIAMLGSLPLAAGCPNDPPPELAKDIYAPLGEVLPTATDEQKATFERGREVALRRFAPSTGLGPTMNVSFCASCHEKPTVGGSAPRYRNFYLTGTHLSDGSFLPGGKSGVLQTYDRLNDPLRPALDEGLNHFTQRNAIPFWGAGLIAEIKEKAILANADPDDKDGDGISGRPNYDRGFVGRFGRKSQTVSLEGFVRGPLNNHAGITSDPLTESDKARLPVDSSSAQQLDDGTKFVVRQAAAPEEPLTDDDDIADPELASEDLFDLVSFVMLMAAPQPDEPTEQTERGRQFFEDAGCAGCHVPTLEAPRGLIPLYSDLLLHDMGEELADRHPQGEASGSEFRTQPLWGIAAAAPYLHDGRADTLDEAITAHGGEAQASRDAYLALESEAQSDLLSFLESLGGADQATAGLLEPEAPIPAPNEPGAPLAGLSESDLTRFAAGRQLFDLDFAQSRGLGPLFNGDSCRACHFDPVIGGAGPLGVDVTRFGEFDGQDFIAPAGGTILHRLTRWDELRPEPEAAHNVFEGRQTPPIFGGGLIDGISDDELLAHADPADDDADGISGRAHQLADGRYGRFGWKAQVPSLREFVRDAMSAELGVTVPEEAGLTFGALADSDEAADPEISTIELDEITFFMSALAPLLPVEEISGGAALFSAVGCDGCHMSLMGADGMVPLMSDLLLHDVGTIAGPGTGVPDTNASEAEFRTPPLWGLGRTAPYLHDGRAETVEAAIMAHGAEAEQVRMAFEALDSADRETLLRFLEAL